MRRALAGALLVVVAAVVPSRAQMAPDGLRGFPLVHSADTHERGSLGGGFFTQWHWIDAGPDSAAWNAVVGITTLQLGYTVADQLELGVALPVRGWFGTGDAASLASPSSQLGFGDITTAGKLVLPLPWQRLRFGARGVASFPTGSRSKGMSSESTDLELGGLLTLDLTELESFVPTRIHLNGGYRWNRNETRGVGLASFDSVASGGFWPPSYPPLPLGENPEWNDQFLVRAGLQFETRRMALFTEFALDLSPNIDGLDAGDVPMQLEQGVVLKLRSGVDVQAAVAVSLQDDEVPATMPDLPDWRFTLGVTWQTRLGLGDDDRDGVPDASDACHDKAEDFDGFEDEDGCPDLDNDFDGIPDERDLAPDLKEDLDGFEDDDGRPDLDDDGDGIRDGDDTCPREPEDYDGDRDGDGCPDGPENP